MASKAQVKYIFKFNKSKTSKIKDKLKDEDDKEVKKHDPIFDGGDIDKILKLAMDYEGFQHHN